MQRSVRPRSFFKKLGVVNGVSNSKAAIQNDCLIRLYDADSELKAISTELDSFDGKKDPIRCNLLVNQLRTAQDKVISLLFQLMDDCSCERASRDYRMKFPDEILLSEGSESLNGQIWFGAECLSAGSNILNHTKESTMLRPMAKTLTQHLDSLRNDLRDLVVDGGGAARINSSLIRKMVAFDHIFATFEYEYVRTMLPIRTVVEIEKLQEVAVLFSETLIDCVKRGLIKQDDIDEFQPIVMIAIPRLAIVRGLLYTNENPIYTRHKSHMCSLFQPFHGPLHSIRKLLRGLRQRDLYTLERMLANDQSISESLNETKSALVSLDISSQEVTKDSETSESVARENNISSYDHDQSGEASTSSNYTNVLMDGLEYPVGQKWNSDEIECPSNCVDKNQASITNSGEEMEVGGCPEVQASSSKSITDKDESQAIHQTTQIHSNEFIPSPSSSMTSQDVSRDKNMVLDDQTRSGDSKISIVDKNSHDKECDNGSCCFSPPESDAQLEKLIADFSPSVNDDSRDDGDMRSQSPPGAVQQSETTTSYQTILSPRISCDIDNGQQSTSNYVTQHCVTNEDARGTRSQDTSVSSISKKERKDAKVRVKKSDESRLDQLFQKQTQQLLHRLFVAISGVADQLQSNFASDLRFILRHIFSSEIDGDEDDDIHHAGGVVYDDDDDDDEDYSNQDQSDSSLPIEQGIEAREANLIDFDSGYTVMDTVYPPVAQSGVPALSQSSTFEYNDRHATGSSVATVTITASATHLHQHPSESMNDDRGVYRASVDQQQRHEQRLNDELLAGIMRASSDSSQRVSHDSPNDPSIMDNSQHQQRLMQQHLQSVSARASARAAAAAAAAAQQAYDQVLVESGQVERVRDTSQRHGERRSRHHHTHGHHYSSSSRSSRRNRGPPPVWVPDQLVVQCSCCQAPFTLFRRRHHCRVCGQIFCADCSKFTKNLNCWGYNGPVRVCESCFNQP